MKGYKLVDEGITNQYGSKFELNKTYLLRGEVKYRENGFHFCTYPENTLRFTKTKRPKDFIIVEVEASGNIECGDDYQENEEYGFDGMYASSQIKIVRIVPREEIFEIIISSNNSLRIRRYIQLIELTEDEIFKIKESCNDEGTIAYLNYYQFKDKDSFYRRKSY